MTDPTRELLAGLAPEPLEPFERMVFAAARLRKVAGLPGWTDSAARHAFGKLAARLESEAILHAHPSGNRCQAELRGLICMHLLLADMFLGNEVQR